MREHELFLCDERVLPMMPKLLGKIFFEAKKQPIPVNMLRKDLKDELARAISSTYFYPSTGTSHSIRISTPSSTTPAKTLENLLAAVPVAVNLLPEQWSNVLSIGIKTSSSLLLPIFSSKLDGRFKDVESAGKDVEMVVEEEKKEEPVKKVQKKVEVSKGGKLAGKGDKKKVSSVGGGGAGKRAKSAAVGKA
ncbi:ribosome biogenesis protein UTP30, partial [Tremellales sp. Uapishka_1]